jgi:O-antigen ligase
VPRSGPLLLLGLLAACAYAAFANGAVGLPEEPRLQIGLCALALCALVAGAGGALRIRTSTRVLVAVGLLTAFAAWAALSLLWSVAPARSWQDANRAIAYTLVVLLGLAVGSSTPRAVERTALGWLAVALAVATYALAGKALPGVVDNTGAVSRLRAPLEYWNALALVCVLGIPVALRLAVDPTRARAVRLGFLVALWWLLVGLGMTYSRGGTLALLAAAAVLTALGGPRLRGLLALGVAFAASLPPLAAGFTLPALSTNGAPLDQRTDEGLIFLAVLAVSAIVLAGVGGLLLALEPRVRWTPARSRRVWRTLAVGGAGLAFLVSVNVAGADGGWRDTLDGAAQSFTKTAKDETFDPARLASTNSGNRWSWWNEALGGWADRPVAGWGAGSFPLVHKRFRLDEVPVQQPHSVPLQFLVETGVVGFLLVFGALALLVTGALARIRRMVSEREHDLGVALLAGVCAWLVHGLLDWDWDIPAVTIPPLLFLGVLCARPGRDRRAVPFRDPEREGRPGLGPLAVAAGVLALACATVSAALPGVADGVASDAAATVDEAASPASLEDAARKAELAARLDPLAIRPLVVGASIAQGRGRLLDARRLLLQAADRAPEDPEVWFRLAGIALQLADRPGFRDAARRALELDPVSASARALAQRAEQLAVSPAASATAAGTPLPLALAGLGGPAGLGGSAGLGGPTGSAGLGGPTGSEGPAGLGGSAGSAGSGGPAGAP